MILASWIVYGHQTHAATKQFVIKEATYQENLAAIRAAVTLSTGDEASFTITVAADDAERLVESIHSGISVKVNPADPANGKVVVTVSVSAKKEETCEITYTIPIVESKAYTVSHGVQMTDATISSYLNLQDRSGSNLAWSDAVVVIMELPLVRTFNVTMDSGKSTTLPIPTIQFHDIQLEEAAPEYFALDKDANRIRRTRRFTYKGKGNSKEVLAAGNIRVIQDKVLVFESRLEKDLKRGGTIRLPAEFASAEEATLQTATKAGRWNRAVSLKNGTLKYQPSDVKEYVIKNHTGSEIELDAIGSDSIKIGVIAAGVLVDPVGDLGDAASANLLDMTSEKLKLHADRLGDLQHFGSNLDPSVIKSAHDEIKSLYEIATDIAKLRASRDGLAEHLAELSGTDVEPEIVTRALERLETIERDLGAEITKRASSQADLVRLLLPYSVE
ncbi:MAG: hypothetical protein Rhob2KO_48880 [Rhodopirellula baltica]